MTNWRPVDYIVAFLTLMVGTLFVGLVVRGVWTDPDHPTTESEQRMSAAIVQSVISVITLYVGAAIQKKRDEEEQAKIEK